MYFLCSNLFFLQNEYMFKIVIFLFVAHGSMHKNISPKKDIHILHIFQAFYVKKISFQ